MTNKQKILQEAAKAARIVRSWPEWKQNILLVSLKSTNDYCRIPVRKSVKSAADDNSKTSGSTS